LDLKLVIGGFRFEFRIHPSIVLVFVGAPTVAELIARAAGS
jgi:hypothetical protein